MPVIKPLSALRLHANKLSQLCHDSGEPIFLTRRGRGDMVLLSLAAYEQLNAQLELYRLLDVAEADVAAGHRGASVASVRGRRRR
jgi:prevent-host-death family protein